MMAPLTEALLVRADPAGGERALDIGCGFGTTAIALSQRVGASGSVLGIDISRPMLELARSRIAAEGIGNIELREADATAHGFTPGAIDLAVSRFGVMFFADPVAAFANIHTGLRDGGRLVFVCWRPLADNPHFAIPLAAARPHLPPQPPPDAHAPGMFAFADPERLRGILSGAGFRDIVLAPVDATMVSGTASEVAAFALQMGPVTRAMADASPEQRQAAEAAVHAALEREAGPDGVRLAGGVWLVSAKA